MPRLSPRSVLGSLLAVTGCTDNAPREATTSQMPLPAEVTFTVPEPDLLPEQIAALVDAARDHQQKLLARLRSEHTRLRERRDPAYARGDRGA